MTQVHRKDDRPEGTLRIPLGFASWDVNRVTLGIAGASVLGFLYLPIVVLMVFSFNSNPITRLPLTEWTLKWYDTAFSNEVLLIALANSVIVGVGAVAICLVIGVPTALALDRYEFPGKAVLRRFVILPLTLPGLITGVSMLAFFNMMGVSLSLATVLIGHGTALTAIVVTNVFARLQRYDRRIEEASADLGAGPLRTFWYVTLPNIRSTLIGSSLIAFTLSFDEIPVTFLPYGPRQHAADVYLVDGPAWHYAGNQRDRLDHHRRFNLSAACRGLHHERRRQAVRIETHASSEMSPEGGQGHGA